MNKGLLPLCTGPWHNHTGHVLSNSPPVCHHLETAIVPPLLAKMKL